MKTTPVQIGPYSLAALPVLFLLAAFALPNFLLLSTSLYPSDGGSGLTLDNYKFFFSQPGYWGAMVRTFAIGLLVALFDIVIAFPIAYFLARTTSRYKTMLVAVALAPLLASVVVRTYGWLVILEENGFVDRFASLVSHGDMRLQMLPSFTAIVVGLAHALLPYCIISLMGAIKAIEPSMERAAMSLGASRFWTFATVTLPLSMPGIVSGLLLVFAMSISAYATPAILGGPGLGTLSTLLYTFMASILDWALGSTIGVILLVSSITLFFVAALFGIREDRL